MSMQFFNDMTFQFFVTMLCVCLFDGLTILLSIAKICVTSTRQSNQKKGFQNFETEKKSC